MARKLRNIGIMAHIDAGKTTVSERILLYAGRTHKLGEVHNGEATLDWHEQERERGITITSAVTSFDWRDCEVHLIDTPGHVDFTVEVERSLRVLDGVIALYDAVAGVEPQSETVWYQANRHRVPRLAFANKMDRLGADFDKTVAEVRTVLHAHPIPIQIPIGAEDAFAGVIDLVEMQAIHFPDDLGHQVERGPVPQDLEDDALAARDRMLELLADVDDDIALAYLEGETIDTSEIKRALRTATIALRAVPFLCGSGLRNKGVQPLLDAVIDYLPAPNELAAIEGAYKGEPAKRARDPKAPFSALIFKVQIIDGRKVVFARVYSGVLESGTAVTNATHDRKVRVKNLYRMHARKRERVERALAGEIVALTDVKHGVTGDTLAAMDAPIVLESIEAREPVISVAVEPETVRERDKLIDALNLISIEDPTVRVEEDADTGDLLLRGMGELHLEVVAERVRSEFKVGIRLGTPSVVRRESITGVGEGDATFERENDDGRIFGRVIVTVSARARDTENLVRVELVDDHPYVKDDLVAAAVEGAEDALASGPISGEELIDVEVVVRALKPDPEGGGGSVIGYRVAAGESVRQALRAAGPVTLEPLMDVDIVIGDEHLGDVIGDLTGRAGTVENVGDSGDRKVVTAVVPLRQMFGYTSALRSMTQGRGIFQMQFRTFDQAGAR